MKQIVTMTLLVLLLSACAPTTPTSVSVAPTGIPTSASLATPQFAPPVSPTSAILPTPTLVPTPIPDVLFVDPSVSLGAISPLVYGSNYGPWLVVSFGMLPAAYNSGVTILRFPAGSWGDHNDVKTYQIDQFMDFAHKVGAEAVFSVRLLDGTPEQAAEMVRYTNIEKKYGVQYWNIGNEPTLYEGELKNRGGTYDTERFNKEWRAFGEAMKNVDPTIKLVGPEINQFSYEASPGATTNFTERDETWMIEFLKANGDLVDVVSFHRYPFPRSPVSGAPSMDELRLNAREWDKIFVHARQLIHETTGRDLPIAVTEWNSAYDKSFGGQTTPDSHFNAIWMADVLGRMIKNGVFMANQWYLTAKAGYGGLGLIAQDDAFPSYYTYQIYKEFGEELVYSSSDDPDLSIYASIREDGVLTIIVVNLSLEAKEKHIQVGTREQAQAGAWLFDPTHNVEPMGGLSLDQEIMIAPQSVLFLEVDQYR